MSLLFVPLLIIAVTGLIKAASPVVKGWVTVVLVLLLGLAYSFIDTLIDLPDATMVQGLVLGLVAIGVVLVARNANWSVAPRS